MSKSKSKSMSKTQATSKKAGADKDYEVGYGKPPLHTRFEKGKSGNQVGSRKKLILMDMRQQVQDIFVAPVVVRDGKTTRRVPKITALIEQKLNEAFKDPHARALPKLLQMAQHFRVFDIKKQRVIDLSCFNDEERALYEEFKPLLFKLLHHSRDPE